MTYQPNIPTGMVSLNQDYVNIKNNFSQLNTQFQVDHVPLTSTSGSPPNGYHTNIHLVPPSTPTSNTPTNYPPNGFTATVGYGQLFAPTTNDGINTDQTLYFLTGSNRLLQLTSNFTPSKSGFSGATFLPGGIIMNWGLQGQSISGSGSINFLQPFPRAILAIWGSPLYTTGSAPSGQASIAFGSTIPTNVTASPFYFNVGSSNKYVGFSWTAIGY